MGDVRSDVNGGPLTTLLPGNILSTPCELPRSIVANADAYLYACGSMSIAERA